MSDVYAKNLQRDVEESQRLDEQFDLLTENLGYLIHPEVLESLTAQNASTNPPTPFRIADLATGTARFLRQVAASPPDPLLAHALLDGSDLSVALFPTPQEEQPSPSPSRITLHQHDIRAPIPSEWEARYDLVHVRQVAAGLAPEDWIPVVSNLARLLKPGGAMQWEECNFSNVVHLRGGSVAECTVAAARRLGQLFQHGLRDHFAHGWDRLETAMRAAGLQQVDGERVSADRVPATRRALTANGMAVIRRWAAAKARAGELREIRSGELVSLEEVEALGVQAEKDIASGCYVRFDIHAAWGFRPVE
ncbi:class I SAM-dependent methyltransferase [Aspergillus saccharolyticus JOP 1030-1]|uniref:Methyltransferase domain-containing protein n=1 Tax=Aspergillus saccharolyticus JOP 1030-1 TaxID=1450539 RepID=A0A318Z807_9EURO|nr:hypothetical protein BP01DRAFT_359423 [Aspergillus saccharolyticus JOP 1030-1]PYH42554.1 hypothetical protein BP01DRAFT_359423 [Aspergillus saccharolyticus JOP 1030-1]